jgi:hypothetical protein
VTPDVEKRAFILKITGMLEMPEGPLRGQGKLTCHFQSFQLQ